MNNLNIKSVLKDVLAIIIITIIVMFVFVACKPSQYDAIRNSHNKTCDSKDKRNKYIVNYLESSIIDTVNYDIVFKIVREPREDLTIHDSCGEMIFEYKD